MMHYIFVCLFAIVQLSTSQNCGRQINDFHKCMRREVGDQSDSIPDLNAEQMTQNLRDCFTKAGCTSPISEPTQAQKQLTKIQRVTFECLRKLTEDDVQPLIEQCMQDNITDWKFPDVSQSEAEVTQKSHTHAAVSQQLLAVGPYVFADDFCSSQTKKSGARQCLSRLAKKVYTDEKHENALEQTLEATEQQIEFCTARGTCEGGMDEKCVEQFEKSKLWVCDCATDRLSVMYTDLDPKLSECLKEDGIEISTRDANLFQLIQSGVNSIAQQFCVQATTLDPCSPAPVEETRRQ